MTAPWRWWSAYVTARRLAERHGARYAVRGHHMPDGTWRYLVWRVTDGR